jgi:hypothetical protein
MKNNNKIGKEIRKKSGGWCSLLVCLGVLFSGSSAYFQI